jgi:glycosyltransferase XagB
MPAMNFNGVSIVIPTWNEEQNIQQLVERLHRTLHASIPRYELIFIDDLSTDKTRDVVKSLSQKYPIKLIVKNDQKFRGKAQSLIGGFSIAQYDVVAMIDADLQYPPEALPTMIQRLSRGSDIVIAKREHHNTSFHKKFLGGVFKMFFAKLLYGFDVDVQSGLKVFKRAVVRHIAVAPKTKNFDLEFLVKAQSAGYVIDEVDVAFVARKAGQVKSSALRDSYDLSAHALQFRFVGSSVIPFTKEMIAQEGEGYHYKGTKYVHHSGLHHTESAVETFTRKQLIIIAIVFAIVGYGFALYWHETLIGVIAVLTVLYFADLLFNFFLIYRSFSKSPELSITPEELIERDKYEFPKYTIFCPLYKEWEVLPQFVTAMSKLDYPKDKLQVMLLLEENDPETIAKAREFNLPWYFDIVVVPHSMPKTKPKACNYGLKFATGEYVVIYDAEDVPDVLQLKKAIVAFEKLPTRVKCIQAKLNYYNPHQNLLTRLFTAEYSLWFDLVLTGLQSIKALIPLGGTSNHFKVADLRELHGWDAFNVTEDCDLGIRLAKKGYTTAVIDSMTLEEANSSLPNWIWQRSRWIKGYIQSYFVHMRHPRSFITAKKPIHLIALQTIVGGKILSMFINPIMWIITISYFAFRPIIGDFIESLFPGPVFYMAIFCLIIGNFLYMYYYMIGCAKREHYDIIKYAFFVPFYWLMMSVAAWVAVYKLVTAPHHWSKTKHGLHLKNKKAMQQVNEKVGGNLVDGTVATAAVSVPITQ